MEALRSPKIHWFLIRMVTREDWNVSGYYHRASFSNWPAFQISQLQPQFSRYCLTSSCGIFFIIISELDMNLVVFIMCWISHHFLQPTLSAEEIHPKKINICQSTFETTSIVPSQTQKAHAQARLKAAADPLTIKKVGKKGCKAMLAGVAQHLKLTIISDADASCALLQCISQLLNLWVCHYWQVSHSWGFFCQSYYFPWDLIAVEYNQEVLFAHRLSSFSLTVVPHTWESPICNVSYVHQQAILTIGFGSSLLVKVFDEFNPISPVVQPFFK